jgi:DNA repair exonuclease SbcCD nuclease subunit
MSKPAFVAITDTHLDEDNFQQVYSSFEQAIVIVKDLGLTELYHLGDHFTSRISQRLDTLLFFWDILDLLERENITLVTIAGNHDKTDQSSERSYLDVFKKSKNLIVFRRGFHSNHRSGLNMFFLPYFTDSVYDEELKKLSEISKTSQKRTCLLTHIGINGVLNNDGNKINNVVEVGKFKSFDLTLIGHYHNYNKVTNKVVYVGSCYPRNFGEDSDKGCIVVNDDLTMERVKFNFVEYEKVIVVPFAVYFFGYRSYSNI